MKKFFALMLVVAMLSVAGSAMATTITASPTEVTVERGNTATVTLTGTASHNGTLEYSLVGTSSLVATLTGRTLTISPASTASAGDYTVTARVVETYLDTEDDVGHIAEKTDSGQVEITVHVTAPVTPKPDGGSSAASSETLSVVKVVIKVVKTIVPSLGAVNEVTVVQVQAPSRNASRLASTIGTFVLPGAPAGTTFTKLLDKAASIVFNAVAKTQAMVEKYAATLANKREGRSGNTVARITTILPEIAPSESGPVDFDITFPRESYGKKPGFDLNNTSATTASFAAADATGGNDAVFLDSTGQTVEVIPDGTGSADAGVLTVVVYVEAGQQYAPYTFVEMPAASADAYDTATGATEKDVELKTEKAVSVTVNYTPTFSPVVTYDVINAVSDDYGKPVYELPYTAASTTATWAATGDEKTYMAENKLEYVASLPVLEGLSDDAVYIAQFTFDNTPTFTSFDAPVFYPNGVSAGAAKTAVYTMDAGSAVKVTSANAKDIVENGRLAYLVFEVANGAFVAADNEEFGAASITFNRPALAVKEITGSSSGETSKDVIPAALQPYIDNNLQLKEAAFVGSTVPTLPTTLDSNGKYTVTIKLNFPVKTWSVTVGDNNGTLPAISASAITDGKSSFKYTSDTSATLSLDPSEISSGPHSVTLTVTAADYPTITGSRSLGSVTGTSTTTRLGSSGGGCSAGSAVLALAVLGSFIITRKK